MSSVAYLIYFGYHFLNFWDDCCQRFLTSAGYRGVLFRAHLRGLHGGIKAIQC